jgi:hypothetical protein
LPTSVNSVLLAVLAIIVLLYVQKITVFAEGMDPHMGRWIKGYELKIIDKEEE